MSKKSGRKRSRYSNATILTHLADLTNNLDNASGCDSDLLAYQITRIQYLATHEISERKALMHRSSSGISVLLKALKMTDNYNVVAKIISLLNVLSNHKYTGQLVKGGVVPAVMTSLLESARFSWNSDEFMMTLLTLLNKLSTKDKRFGIKARLSGILPLVSGLLKKYQEQNEKVVIVLTLLRPLATSGPNAEQLGKLGCLNVLTKLLTKASHRDAIILKHCISVLLPLLKQRSNASRTVVQGCVKHLVLLHEQLHRTDTHCHHAPLRKKILHCLKVCISTEANLQVFHKNNGLNVLYTTAQQSSEGCNKASRGITSLTCLVLRKCLPLVPFPLDTQKNPISFPLPEKEEIKEPSSLSESSSAKTTTTDLSSLQLASSDLGEVHEEERNIGDMFISAGRTLLDLSTAVQSDVPCIHQTLDTNSQEEQEFSGDDQDPPCVSSSDSGDRSLSNVLALGCDCVTGQQSDYSLVNVPIPAEPVEEEFNANIKIDMDLEKFMRFFPEFEEAKKPSKASAFLRHPTAVLNKIQSDTRSESGVRPVVLVPTCNSESLTETANDLQIKKEQFLKTATPFVEEPSPQVLGHLSSVDSEPYYTKMASTERKLCMSDIARVVDANTLMNKTIFNLDSLISTQEEQSKSNDLVDKPSLDLEIQEIVDDLVSEVVKCTEETDIPCVSDVKAVTSCWGNQPKSHHLGFESRFESGNLRKVIQVRRYEYDLLLNADIGTNHHHQWFYFKVFNNEAGIAYRFNIINCEKVNSQFNYGMQPLMYSTTEFQLKQQGWTRTGTNISYYSNNYHFSKEESTEPAISRKKKNYYTLTFTVVFKHAGDTCYFAYHYPYTYSMLKHDLDQIEENIKDKDFYYSRQPLCTTLCGNICPILTISSGTRKSCDLFSIGSSSELESEDKKYIVLSARVHPGESNSSWIMKGVLHYLTSDHPNAQLLREKFIFKIIPMLNPDGVIHGRCSLSGEDLNRQWITPDPVLHPPIHSTKLLLQWLVATNRKPEVYCDFHGHSRKKNIFMYGCKDLSGSNIEQVLPRHLDRIAPFFSYNVCSFVVEKSKDATARVVVWKELGIARSYTMESTYCGADQGQHKGRQIETVDLEEMGTLFCEGLLLLDEQSENACCDSDLVDGRKSCNSDSSCKSSMDDGSASSHDPNEDVTDLEASLARL